MRIRLRYFRSADFKFMMQDEQLPHFKKLYEFCTVVTYGMARAPTATASARDGANEAGRTQFLSLAERAPL